MVQANQQPQDSGKILSQIKELISKNASGLIAIPAKATPDAIAAATSLYLALTKMGKTVALVCSEIPESDFVGADKIQNTLSTGGNNLVVSFPYKDGAIDKVDYNIENERFNLIIAPREGFNKLEPGEVQFSYAGGKIEFIITIDAPTLNALGEIYQKNESTFTGKNIVNIDRHLINNGYGTINFVVKTSSSTSELVYQVIRSLGVQVDKDTATNLYNGIAMATNNFTSYSVNADTFEAIANLMRSGAVRKPMAAQFARPGMPQMPGMRPMAPMGAGMPPMQGMNQFQQPQQQQPQQQQQRPQYQQQQPQNHQPQIRQQMQQQQQPQPMMQQRNEQQTTQIENVEQEAASPESTMDQRNPENWLKPKIFSDNGGGLV